MIDGAILAIELGLLLLLLWKVWRVQIKKEDGNTGFFAYFAQQPTDESKDKLAKPFKKPPHA